MSKFAEIEIFDTKFTNSTRDDACKFVEEEISKKRKVIYIAVKDVALTVRSLEDSFLNSFYKTIPEKIFVDGKGLMFAGRLLCKKFKEMVGGPGIYYEILRRGEHKGYNFFYLGATRSVLKETISNVKKRHPRINIVGFRDGYFSELEEGRIVQEINESKCDVLFIGISSPKREEFVSRNMSRMNNLVCIAIGGVFDNEAGVTKYAPKLISSIGMEWLHRVVQEPQRLAKRYLYTHTKFVFYFLTEFKNDLAFIISQKNSANS